MLNIKGPKEITDEDRQAAEATARSLEERLRKLEMEQGVSLDFKEYSSRRAAGMKDPAVEEIYDALFQECTLLHSPFEQEHGRESVILYAISGNARYMARIDADFKEDEFSDGNWTEMPRDAAYDPECSDIFRDMVGRSGANLYIVYNPSSRIDPDILMIMTLRDLYLLYEETRKCSGDADEEPDDVPGIQVFSFCQGTPSEDVVDDIAREHASSAYLKSDDEN